MTGRPSVYEPRFARAVFNLRLVGIKDKARIAKCLGISLDTLKNWLDTIPDFSTAYHEGGEEADGRVANALYQNALAGDTRAAIWWLSNRQPASWRLRGADSNAFDSDGNTQLPPVIVVRPVRVTDLPPPTIDTADARDAQFDDLLPPDRRPRY